MSTATDALDTTFQALANETRRAVVQRLGRGPATVTELAEPFDMALPSFMQHLRVLEDSGVVLSRKRGRVRTLRLRSANITRAAKWLGKQQDIWEQRLDRLDTFVKTLEDQDERTS